MSTPQTIVIVGAGLAGAKAAQTLRAEGFEGCRRVSVDTAGDAGSRLASCCRRAPATPDP